MAGSGEEPLAGSRVSSAAAGGCGPDHKQEARSRSSSVGGNPRYYARCDAGGALRAARRLLFVPTAKLFPPSSSSSSSSSLALLRSIPAPERALWLLSRCPSAVPRGGISCGEGEGGDSLSLARWLDDSRAVLLSSSDEEKTSPSSSSSSLAGRVREALREAGSAPELEEGWPDLRAEIERCLAGLEGAAEELQLSAAAKEA